MDTVQTFGRAVPGRTQQRPHALQTLLSEHLRFDDADPLWADRDRLVLSEAVAAGWAGPDTPPTAARAAQTVQGPAGLALGTGLGMALAERLLAARFGRSLVDHRVWVVTEGHELSAGLGQEAASMAGLHGLGKLTLIAIGAAAEAGHAAFAAHGWRVRQASSGDAAALQAAFSAASRSRKPTLIICHTAPDPSPPPCSAGAPPGAARSAAARRAWLKRLNRHGLRQDFERGQNGHLPPGWYASLSAAPALAPASASPSAGFQAAIARLASLVPEWTGLPVRDWPQQALLSALPGPAPATMPAQALGASLAGMALHGGFVPIGQVPLDRFGMVEPALRLAAQHGRRLILVLTEPEAACPVAGQRAALRAMRNLHVFRPAETSETLECCELAFRRGEGPSVLLLSEAARPPLADRPARTRCTRGGYLLHETEAPHAAVTLIASGSELAVALAVRLRLEAAGVRTAVASLPCWELFAQQPEAWRESVLGPGMRIGLEAGSGFGWERWLGSTGLFIGLPDLEDIHAAILQHLAKASCLSRRDLDTSANILEKMNSGN